MSTAPAPVDPLQHIRDWADQTVIFALGTKSTTKGGLPPPQQIVEAKRIVGDIRAQVLAHTTGQPGADVLIEFCQRVIDWSSDYIAGTAVIPDDRVRHIRAWGRQTLALAASVRADEIGNPINSDKRAQLAYQEFQKTGIELWDAATKECKQPVQAPEQVMKFAAKVFDWVKKHLDGCELD